MRYLRVGWAAYAIALLLIGAAFTVAWVRSRDAETSKFTGSTLDEDSRLRTLGATIYASECAVCHGGGEKRGTLPPLRGYTIELLLAPGGRDDLIRLLLTGDVRRRYEHGDTFDDAHPPFGHLSDEEIAALLNHLLVNFGNRELLPPGTPFYSAGDVARRRR